jgi:hypothetical protein
VSRESAAPIHRIRIPSCLLVSVWLAALLLVPVWARAQGAGQESSTAADTAEMAEEHRRQGLAALRDGRIDEALSELKKAYLLSREPGLLIAIARAYGARGDRDSQLYYYKKYLAEASAGARERVEVMEAIDRLLAQQAAEGGEAELSQVPGPWSHAPVDSVPPERPLDIWVATPVTYGVRVFLHYRAQGQAEFAAVEMKRRGPLKVARISASEVRGTSLQYYLEARDKSGAVVEHSGSVEEPHVVSIEVGAPLHTLAASLPKTPGSAGTKPGSEGAAGEEEPPPEPGAVSAATVVAVAPPRVSRMRLAGALLLSTGTALGVVGGSIGLSFAAGYARAVRNDACPSGPRCPGEPYVFDDPEEPNNDRRLQDLGHLSDTLGGLALGVGGAAATVGVVLLAVDAARHASGERAKPSAGSGRTGRGRPGRVLAAPVITSRGAGISAAISF